MEIRDVDRLLGETLEDLRLSRGESRALREVLADLDLKESDRAAVRNLAFQRAADVVKDTTAIRVLDWLREVMKALDAATRLPEGPVASKAAFSPGDACLRQILNCLDGTARSADLCVFTITDDRLCASIISAHRRGVRVRVVTDDDKAEDRGSDIRTIHRAGIPVAMDESGHMHHKFAIFDGRVLLGGSYNWTRSAAHANHENIVVSDDTGLVAAFEAEFEGLWNRYPKL